MNLDMFYSWLAVISVKPIKRFLSARAPRAPGWLEKAAPVNPPKPAQTMTGLRLSLAPDSWLQTRLCRQEIIDRRPIGRIETVMDQTHDTVRVDNEIGAQVGRVALDAAPAASGSHHLHVAPHRPRIPGSKGRTLQFIRLVDLALRVEQELEGGTGLLQPGLGCRKCAEGEDQDLDVWPLKFTLMLSKLCHVLAAGQSAQVPQEYLQHAAARAQRFAQRDHLTVHRQLRKTGSGIAAAQHGLLFFCAL
jgi:hypothetical protein